LAIAFKTEGIDPQKAEKINKKLKKLIHKIYEAVRQPEESIHYHEPHPDNLALHPEP
jgi:hypothetical protein